MTIDPKRDKELADAVRHAADKLCIALDRAGEVCLEIYVSVHPHHTRTFEDGSKAQTNWQPTVSVRRVHKV